MIEKAIIDSDFAIKLGRFKKIRLLEELIPEFCQLLYIHRYVYRNEVLIPARVKEQLNSLLEQEKAIIVDRNLVAQQGAITLAVYDATQSLLLESMRGSRKYGKNWGEIVSLAAARAVNIPYLLSDERYLQEIIDEHINIDADDSTDIQVIRISDFIQWMKEQQYPRRKAKMVWLAAGYSADSFSALWPVQAMKSKLQGQH
jgi:hypothetical protein